MPPVREFWFLYVGAALMLGQFAVIAFIGR